ncbi:hypothetical protein NPIL_455871 [Nephila pilipes]|uniref:Uncharacterized protein n=1 Tax=Nephila pilipes TaxID=299642 RepID=A0A8X6TCG6_NEPPI|nr:hypothetical protein NPIL_455871 [Nephila pilipes]
MNYEIGPIINGLPSKHSSSFVCFHQVSKTLTFQVTSISPNYKNRARPLHCPYINSKFLTRIQPKREDAKFRTKLQVNAHDPSPPHRGVTIYPVKSKVFANYRMQVVAVGVASGMRRSPKPGNRLSGRKRCSSPGPSPADRENKFIKKK